MMPEMAVYGMIRVVDIREMAGLNQTCSSCGGGGSSGPAGKSNDPDWKQCGRSFGSRSLCTFAGGGGSFRRNVPAMDSITIQRYLIRGANRLNIFDYPNKTWGYGSLDLYDAFRSV